MRLDRLLVTIGIAAVLTGCSTHAQQDTASTPTESSTTTSIPVTSPTDSSTTTSIPATSTTGSGPLVASCNAGGSPQFEPSIIYMSCADGNLSVTKLIWSAWNETVFGSPREALGTGIFNVNDCVPDCAQGHFSSTQVSVTLSNPVRNEGAIVWGTLQINSATGALPGDLASPPSNVDVDQLLFPVSAFGAP